MSAMIRRHPDCFEEHQVENVALGVPPLFEAISELTRSSNLSLALAAATWSVFQKENKE